MTRYIFPVVGLIIAGCTGVQEQEQPSRPIQLVGKYADYNETFVGEIRPVGHEAAVFDGDPQGFTDPAFITLRIRNSKLYCEGVSRVMNRPGLAISFCGTGTTSLALLRCGDGRRLTADMRTTSCRTGEATGSDSSGARFSFVYGLPDAGVQQYLASAEAETRGKPGLGEAYESPRAGSGTGFLISADGVVVTNHHVIDGASSIEVHQGSMIYAASVLARDPANDLAILKTDIKRHPLSIASARGSMRGDEVLTLGYPLTGIEGESQKATFGRINATSGIQDDVRYLQIDIPIQPGNSGGPLLNRRGEVIGVVSATLNNEAVYRRTGTLPQNVNYAIKADYVSILLPASVSATAATQPQEIEIQFSALAGMAEDSVVRIVAKP